METVIISVYCFKLVLENEYIFQESNFLGLIVKLMSTLKVSHYVS